MEKSKDSHSDQHLISPYSYPAKSFITMMKTKEMIANLKVLIVKLSLSVPKEMCGK